MMTCVMDHIVLNVVDSERMMSFYAQVLELETERLDEFRSGAVAFPSVRLNEDTIIDLFPRELWQGSAEARPGKTNLNHFCIVLSKSEWDRLRARLADNRVPVTTGPVLRWGAHGSGISIYFEDPEGNLIEARHYEADGAGDEALTS